MKKRIVITYAARDVDYYREFLFGIATSLDIERFFAENFKQNGKNTVEVLIESPEDKVDSFIKIISSQFPEGVQIGGIRMEE